MVSPRLHSRSNNQVGPQAGVSDCEPTLLWDKETTSVSDADSESTRQMMGHVWPPQKSLPLGLEPGTSSEALGKNRQTKWRQASVGSGPMVQETSSVHSSQNHRAIPLLEEGVRLGMSQSCHTLAAAPVSRRLTFHGPPHLTLDYGCLWRTGILTLQTGATPLGQLPHGSIPPGCPEDELGRNEYSDGSAIT